MCIRNRSKFCIWLAIAALVLVADQVSKFLVKASYVLHQRTAIISHLNFRLAHNNGAAFGMLAGESGWQRWVFIVIAIVISVVIIVWTTRLNDKDSWEGVGFACILGGALGNLIDRFRFGYVIDFIDFYIGSWHWYTFNLADAAICIGAAILICVSFKKA